MASAQPDADQTPTILMLRRCAEHQHPVTGWSSKGILVGWVRLYVRSDMDEPTSGTYSARASIMSLLEIADGDPVVFRPKHGPEVVLHNS